MLRNSIFNDVATGDGEDLAHKAPETVPIG